MASTKVPVPAESRALLSRTSAIPTLLALQNSTGKLANFEFFEQIQQIPFNFPHGSSKYRLIWAHCVTHLSTLFSFSLLDVSIQIQHCPIPTRKQSSTSDTAAGILVATHSTGAWVLFSIYVIYIQQLLCTRQMETAVNWKRFAAAIDQLHFPRPPMVFWTHFECRYVFKTTWKTIWFTATECVCCTVRITSSSLPSKVFLGKLINPFVCVSVLLLQILFYAVV